MEKIHSCSVNKLDDTIYRTLYYLNHGRYGEMQKVFYQLRNNINLNENRILTNGVSHYFTQDDIILGWCLTFQVLYKNNWQHIAYLYVNEQYRGNGIGTKLATYVKRMYPDILAHKEYTSCFDNFGQADSSYYNDLEI